MSKARVLIADDSSTIQKVFELAFEKENIDVILAGEGREAFGKTREMKPDVVIADVNMPDMDGFELCRMIKGDSEISSIPVYLLSSALDDFDEEMAKQVGASGRFEKPFRSEDMVSKVLAAIGFTGEGVGEDTFEDIDVSLDNVLSADMIEDESEESLMEEEEALGEELESSPVHDVIDLVPESRVENGEDEAEEEEDYSMEVVSGEEEILEEDEVREADDGEETLVIENEETDSLLRTRRLEEESVSEEDRPALETPPPVDMEHDDFSPMAEADIGDSSGLSEEAQRLLKEIDEADSDMEQVEAGEIEDTSDEAETVMAPPELEPAGRSWDNGSASVADISGQVKEAVGEAFGRLEDGPLKVMIDEAVEKAIAARITDERFEAMIKSSINSAIEAMRPQILETFNKVATDVTLNVAEDLVRQTIEQIKSGG